MPSPALDKDGNVPSFGTRSYSGRLLLRTITYANSKELADEKGCVQSAVHLPSIANSSELSHLSWACLTLELNKRHDESRFGIFVV